MSAVCAVDHCDRPSRRLRGGYCHAHYQRARRGVPMQAPIQERNPGRPCSLDGCAGEAHARGMCYAHYRWCRGTDLWVYYRLTVAQYDRMLADQAGGCALCVKPPEDGRRLDVDHDHACCPGKHSCGKCVRGLLCNNCNSAMGQFGDRPDLCRRAADYLEAFNREFGYR